MCDRLTPKNYGDTWQVTCRRCGAQMIGMRVVAMTRVQPKFQLVCPVADCNQRLLLFAASQPGYPYLHLWRSEIPSHRSFTEVIEEQMAIHIATIDAKRATKH